VGRRCRVTLRYSDTFTLVICRYFARGNRWGRKIRSRQHSRWVACPWDMPVRVVTFRKAFLPTVVEGRGTEMSEGANGIVCGILMNQAICSRSSSIRGTSSHAAIVRSRNGFCFGMSSLPFEGLSLPSPEEPAWCLPLNTKNC